MQVAEPPRRDAQRLVHDQDGDFVLHVSDFRPGLEPAERALLLEEAWRLGLGVEYSDARPTSLCLNVGRRELSPDLGAVLLAVGLIDAALVGRQGPHVRYGFIPYQDDVDAFVEVYHGDLKTFAEGVAS